MARKVTRTDWRAVVLNMAIETSSMEVLLRNGRRQTRPITRVIFCTADGATFSGPRIKPALRRALERFASPGVMVKTRRV